MSPSNRTASLTFARAHVFARAHARALALAFAAATAVSCNAPTQSAAPAPVTSAAVAVGAPTTPAAALAAPDRKGIQISRTPSSGSVEALVQAGLARATAAKRTLVVYVGATWCQPCQAFHVAAEHGDLDAAFPALTLLEFDLDRDRERLASAGYVSKYIPLFALPAADGKASGKQIEGGIKGDGAVGFIVPRLKEMLSD